MSNGALIGLVAVFIPIVAIVFNGLRRWHRLELQAAQRDVDLRRRFRCFDEIERRVVDIERHITSPTYALERQIADLGKGR
jgi:phage shock protein C